MRARQFGPLLSAIAVNVIAIGWMVTVGTGVSGNILFNLTAAIALVIGMDLALQDAAVPALLRAVGLLGMIATLPLPWLIVTGGEHVLQAAACVWLLLALRYDHDRRWRLAAVVLAAALPMIRIESILLIAAAALVTAFRDRNYAASLALAGLLTTAALTIVLPGSLSRPALLEGDVWLAMCRLTEPAAWQAWLSLGVVSGMLLGLAVLNAHSQPPLKFGSEAAIVLLAAHLQILLIDGRFNRYDAFLYGIVTVSYVSSLWQARMRLVPGHLWSPGRLALAAAIALPVLGFLPTRGAARDRFLNTPQMMRSVSDVQPIAMAD